MRHGRSLVAILVAMQWANKDVFNSGSDILCNVGLREGGEDIYMHVDTDMHIYMHARERVILEYQLQNRVENLADVSTRCAGLLQGEDEASGRNIGKVFNPVLKLVFENYPFSCLSQLRSPHLIICMHMHYIVSLK